MTDTLFLITMKSIDPKAKSNLEVQHFRIMKCETSLSIQTVKITVIDKSIDALLDIDPVNSQKQISDLFLEVVL